MAANFAVDEMDVHQRAESGSLERQVMFLPKCVEALTEGFAGALFGPGQPLDAGAAGGEAVYGLASGTAFGRCRV